MTDTMDKEPLVERLQAFARVSESSYAACEAMEEAATEIARLRKALEQIATVSAKTENAEQLRKVAFKALAGQSGKGE